VRNVPKVTASFPQPETSDANLLEKAVGYLNFSAGATDPQFLSHLNELFRRVGRTGGDPVEGLRQWLLGACDRLTSSKRAFADVSQARGAIGLLTEELLPAYRRFHRDLLHHQPDEALWRPFFLGRAYEAILQQAGPWDEGERIVSGALQHLNDYVGYRPTATLTSGARSEPYAHELVRPIPLYVRGAGVACGPYEEIVTRAMSILKSTDAEILSRAWFDLERLEEIALDPRAYDFDHPVNRRPNYHFGQWDPYQLDDSQYYCRFVLQQHTLDALLSRCQESNLPGFEQEGRLFEAAAVLAGTMLMASGTSGDAPSRHDSTVTLSTLLPHIASYRDDFYHSLLQRVEGPLGERLRDEARQSRQPLGGARQHLNQELARRRALQIQRVHLALLFARMGRPAAALQQADSVRVAAARMLTAIYCRLTEGHDAIDRGELEPVAEGLEEIENLMHRAIECGALADPWNIVGFAANFSLFPALENSVHDWRVDELIELVEQVLDLAARAWSEAAAIDNGPLEERFSANLARLAQWWDRYASSSVEGVKRLVAQEIQVSANFVAGALNAWHKAGAAAGDIGFWRMFVDQFDTSKAFQLVVEALLDHGDLIASRALLMQWVHQRDRTPLVHGDAAMHPLAFRWLAAVETQQHADGQDRWPEVVRFFDFLEANAEEYWEAPTMRGDLPGIDAALALGSQRDAADGLGGGTSADRASELEDQEEDDEEDDDYAYDYDYDDLDDDDLDDELDDGEEEDGDDEERREGGGDYDDDDGVFEAAYEEMVYRDSTDDGQEGDIVDEQERRVLAEWEAEAKRLEQRLRFLKTVARLWRHVAIAWGDRASAPERLETFGHWLRRASANYYKLHELAESMHRRRIPPPTGSRDSLVEYDRLRSLKDAMIQNVVATCVETVAAARLLMAVCESRPEGFRPFDEALDTPAVEILSGILAGDPERVRKSFPGFLDALRPRQMLYLPHFKGGNPRKTVATRGLQRLVYDLLGWLPRLGLIRETSQLLSLAQQMESDHPMSQEGAVTEFDRLFENGYQSIVRALIAAAEKWDHEEPEERARQADHMLVDSLQQLTERQLDRWLAHSRTLRLSVVEKLSEPLRWQQFVEFVRRYGKDLFTQSFLGSRGNLRGILHQGVAAWLEQLQEADDDSDQFAFISQLGEGTPPKPVIDVLTTAIETVDENYAAYRDYNTTTTQSDHGELFYMFVDFLRLRAAYNRVAWNLKPVVWAHEILVRHGRRLAAEMWREAFAERTAEVADEHLIRLSQMSTAYGMQLPTVAERLHERFVRPLLIDRLCALVEPAMTGSDAERHAAFQSLQTEIDDLASHPQGAGLDVPDWLAALEEEVTDVRARRNHLSSLDRIDRRIGQVQLSFGELFEQLGGSE
jgi:hypothetical protein